MPGKVKVKIMSGRNLPVMDRSSDTTDAYVEIKLGNTTYKTDVCRKSLHPTWNSEWYRFELDDSELQDEPLQIRLMDHDTYSANDAIGKVYIDLNPLLLPAASLLLKSNWNGEACSSTSSVMSGWLPVYDTMHGIRGEVNVTVKVELFSDSNKFRQSSCGVHFFCSKAIPYGYHAETVHGFVEELVVNDDPEYQWIDKIRTPRASNEARQTSFFKLSGELQRKIGLKVLDLGGNAVVGYSQSFDLEGESGIVARGIGTAVTLVKMSEVPSQLNCDQTNEDLTTDNRISVSPEPTRIEHGHYRTESVGNKMAFSPAKPNSAPSMHRRSSDSDLSITPKGNSLTGSDKSGVGYIGQRSAQMVHSGIHQDNFELLEYPFLTMSKYPQQFIMYLGGIVSARSVKLLERITNIEEPESRDMWWSELRLEIRSHARTLNCNSVLGYSETTTICEDVCVLSAIGTAAIIGYHYNEVGDTVMNIPPTPSAKTKESVPSTEQSDKEKLHAKTDPITMPTDISGSHPASPEHDGLSYAVYNTTPCSICHLPYSLSTSIRVVGTKCSMCRRGKVPDVLITTTELPDEMPTVGRGCILQAYVCRPLKELKGESNAKEISDALPFVEYELHRILVNKLKIKGMNSIFGLKVRISIGERLLIGIATGTAAFLTALPAPPIPVLVSDQSTDESTLSKLQKQLSDTVRKNREMYQLTRTDDMQNGTAPSDNEDSEGEQGTLDLSNGNKEPCILEIDGPEDKEILSFLTEPIAPAGFHVVNTEFVPGLEGLEIVKNLQMFTQIWRGKTPTTASLGKYVQNLLQSVYFKLRRMIPCALCNVQFIINLPEPEEIQMCVLGMALGLTDSPRAVKNKKKTITNDDMIFNLEDDQINDNEQSSPSQLQSHSLRGRSKSPLKNRFFPSKQTHMPYRERHGVDITPLSYVPGGKIEKYLGNLNFFFIRETTSIREEGGLSGFIHSFVTEALAILRAHVAALGGNALVAYFMTKCILNHNLHKNQGQCLINIGGDVVYVSYFNEENA